MVFNSCSLFAVGAIDVKMIGKKDPVSAGRVYEFRCQAVGARYVYNIKDTIKTKTRVYDFLLLSLFSGLLL